MDDKKSGNQIVSSLEDVNKKLPALPPKAVDVLVSIAPWIALIFGILGVLSGLAGFGLLTAFSPVAMMGGVSGYGLGYVSAIILLASSVLMLVAFPGLKKRSGAGWNWLFWSEVVSIVGSLLTISIGSVVGGLIGLYILFQMKPRYR